MRFSGPPHIDNYISSESGITIDYYRNGKVVLTIWGNWRVCLKLAITKWKKQIYEADWKNFFRSSFFKANSFYREKIMF